MAWRIDTHVVRGEVDNRTRGRVVGRIWFLGRNDPIEIELQGDAARDLAGRKLQFVNPAPKAGLEVALAQRQAGVVGQFTASRKVRVPEIPIQEWVECPAQKKPFPWHWANSVYLEWYSIANGHVVIESADYQLIVDPVIGWEMSVEEEARQQSAKGEAVKRFFDQLGFLSGSNKSQRIPSNDIESADELFGTDSSEENWGTDEPLSEEEADELIADSDRLADRLMARLDEAGEGADLEAILEEELGRRQTDSEAAPMSPQEEADRAAWVDELNRAAEEISKDMDGPSPADRRHPLSERARVLTLRLMADVDEGGRLPGSIGGEHPVIDLVRSITKAGGKLAGALDGRDWPPLIDECGLCIAWLKRSRGFLTDALVAGDFCREQALVPREALNAILGEVTALQADIDVVIEELRERLARGFD